MSLFGSLSLWIWFVFGELETHLTHIDLDIWEHCLIAKFRTEERGLSSWVGSCRFFCLLASSLGKLHSHLYRMLFHLHQPRESECLPAKHYAIQLTSATLILSFILTQACACFVVGFRSTCCHVSGLQRVICASNTLLNNLHIDPARPLWFMAWDSENWNGGMKLLQSRKAEIIRKAIRISLSLCIFLILFQHLGDLQPWIRPFVQEAVRYCTAVLSNHLQSNYKTTDLVFWYIKPSYYRKRMQLPIKSHRGVLNVSRTRLLLSLMSNSYVDIISSIGFIILQNNNVLYKRMEICPKGI